ncbi:SusC/RagA family TonB-linked outer membrane protein [Dysgonomonas sp. GY75]|uniref:SusC/RagA family TonB-linked outer membrane protein n=1 Tax=Dysgonomonas sp. GY75 TaxID=2780419 RepID=UPI00293BCE1D|nr:SusC/RagA family TonB-linked outer membrane protein [Dysgonomonas sp. GY75]
MQRLRDTRLLSVQQLLKGNVAGVYVQENNGEPGSIQSMLIRGLSSPIFSNKDVSGVQPVVYVNGIPLAQDLPYIYDFKIYDINPVGAASNILAGLDIQSIESVEVIKDPLELARLGPLAANGAIWIITKDGFYGGKNISINASAGMAFAPSKIKMTNGAYEKAFRQNFYDTYNISAQEQYYPGYLSDTRESNYFGTPDWADSYYNSSPTYNVNASIGSRSTAANYIFTLGITQDAGIVNNVGLTKYNIGFALNMTPLKGLTASTYINANRIIRKRNKNLRDRLAEIEYFLDLSMPLAPANGTYDRYLGYHELTKDENLNNLLNGYLSLRYTLDRFYANVGLMLDYNTNVRHAFWPSSLMESVSSVSDYSGYNRRLIGRVNSGYLFDFGNHGLDIHWDGSIQSDYSHYNYIHGLDGEDDTKTISNYFLKVFRLADRMEARLVSTSFSLDYNYNKLFYADALVRYDGSSNIQLDDRWLFTPSFSLGWDLRKLFFDNSSFLSKFFLKSSWARLGHLVQSDRFALGPNYVSSEMQWNGQPLISSSNGFATVTRPYSIGWIDYDMGWPYSDKLSVDINTSFLNNRISAGISLYENREKDMIVQVPTVKEFGYNSKFMNGMEISNKGIDLNISASILPHINKDRLSWDMAFNMNYNRNELKKLPDGLYEVVVDGRKLQVGQSIDAFWLYQNNGIYNDDSDVSVKDGKRLSLGGIAFQKGDPIWVDQNDDNIINDKDRILKGHALPQFTGGWTTQFRYKQFDLAFHIFFALGHSALNIRDHQRYDFINIERTSSFNSIKEITFWRKDDNQRDNYPIYNPLSKVHPYRAEQDMFLEKLSYLKLRNVTLGYTLPLKKKQSLESLYFYLTANNIFTVTDFSGNDPELVGFSGYYDGYSIPIPRSLSLGLRFNF